MVEARETQLAVCSLALVLKRMICHFRMLEWAPLMLMTRSRHLFVQQRLKTYYTSASAEDTNTHLLFVIN